MSLAFLSTRFLFISSLIFLGFHVENSRTNSVETLSTIDCSQTNMSSIMLDNQLYNDSARYVFYNIRGILADLQQPLFMPSSPLREVQIESSCFDLYDASKKLMGQEECIVDNFPNETTMFFGNLAASALVIDMNTCNLRRPICPFLFKNANIKQLSLQNYGRTHLYRNIFTFYDLQESENKSVELNSNIDALVYDNVYRLHLRSDKYNYLLFAQTRLIAIKGTFFYIDKDVFQDFRLLINLVLVVFNTEEFFHSSTNQWLASVHHYGIDYANKQDFLTALRAKTKRIFFTKIFQNLNFYSFPDEDFCLFKHVPRYESCTYKFLCEHNKAFSNHSKIADLKNSYFDDQELEACHFDERLSMCFNSSELSKPSKIRSTFFEEDITYALIWIDFIGSIITFPMLTTLAFVLNLLVILVIRSEENRKEKLFDSKSFRFIEMNSAFNCIECLISQLRLMGICMGANSVYCSPIRRHPFVFYVGAIDYYLSEAMKSCSMLTGLFFSLERYIETSQTKNRALKAFSHTKSKHLTLVIVVYGFIFSFVMFFAVEYSTTFVDPFDIPSIFFIRSDIFRFEKLRTYFYFLHFILNDLIILLLNIIVDGCLVCHIKNNLKLKLEKKQKMSGQEASKADCRKLNEEEKRSTSTKRKANAMIIISVVICVFCRLPELTGVFLLYFSNTFFGLSCTVNVFCYLMTNFIEYMYMLSYIFNILLYYHFNSFFKRGFRDFFTKIK